jgi:phytol kinase
LSAAILPYLALGAGSLVFGFLLGSLSGWMARRDGPTRRLSRKVFHIGIFTGAAPAQLWMGFWGVVLYGTVIGALVGQAYLRGEGAFLFRALTRDGEVGARRRQLLAPLAATVVGGILSVFLVGPFAVVGYLVCGWGDGVGEIVGERWGRRTYGSLPLNGRRSVRTVEGSLAVLGGGFLGGWAALGLLGFAPLLSVAVGLLAGAVGSVSEGLSPEGTDNLWVQLLPSLASWWILG